MILWSGGVDSTAVLKLYLEKTKVDIVAVHFNQVFHNNLRRNKFEQSAVDAIEPELQKIRRFTMITVKVNFNSDLYCRDMVLLPSMAIPLAYTHDCKKIVIGYVSDSREHNTQVHHIQLNNSLLNKISRQFYLSSRWDWIPKFDKAQKNVFGSKEYYIGAIENYFDKTWFCRRPDLTKDGEIGCGKCHTCKHVILSLRNRISNQKSKTYGNEANIIVEAPAC